jgi:tRNA pseudouridine55 synthase
VAQVKRIRRAVDGIILLDKPKGFSSNAALQKVRWLLNAEKAGHTGSLDPLATGVLPLCFGEATKFSQYLLDADKGYETLMQLGVTTTTADAEGEVLERRPVKRRYPVFAVKSARYRRCTQRSSAMASRFTSWPVQVK